MSEVRELDLPVSAIRPRPGNRLTRNIEELAESIKDRGLLNAVLVRVAPQGKGGASTEYELIGGERRWRAHLQLGRTMIRASVHEGLEEDQAEELGEIDNLQRDDLTPIEEAEAYQRMLDVAGSTAELARRVGRTETHVRQRMRLADLVDEIRVMVDGGSLDLGAAEAIAQQQPVVQRKLVPELKKLSGRITREELRDVLHRHLHDLAEAPFDTSDATLVPTAPACGSCPRRTGKQGTLVEVIDQEDVCLDAECWDAKKDAAARAKIEDAKKRGLHVLSKAEAKKTLLSNGRTMHGADYVGLTENRYVNDRAVPVAKLVGADVPRSVAVDDDGRVVELVPKSAVDAAAKAKAKTPAGKASASKKGAETATQREERARRDKVVLLKRSRDLALAAVREKVEKGRISEDVVLQVAIAAVRSGDAEPVARARGLEVSKDKHNIVDWTGAIEDLASSIIEDEKDTTARRRRLLALIAELAVGGTINVGQWQDAGQGSPAGLRALGVDLVEMRREATSQLAKEKREKAEGKPAPKPAKKTTPKKKSAPKKR